MDTAAKIAFIQSALHRMSIHTHPFVASILGIEKDGAAGQHVGSGIRITANGKLMVLTAAHVIEQARGLHSRFAVTAVRGGPPIELHGEPTHVDQKHDVAAYDLPPDYPTEGIGFWPMDRAEINDEKLETDVLVVHGFPGIHSRFSALAGGLINRSLPYAVMLRTDDLPQDLTASQFAVDYDTANMQGGDGRPMDWVDPHGLSGSPVWRVGASGRTVDEWDPDMSLLVGVVTQWRPDEKILVATRWRHVSEMLGMR